VSEWEGGGGLEFLRGIVEIVYFLPGWGSNESSCQSIEMFSFFVFYREYNLIIWIFSKFSFIQIQSLSHELNIKHSLEMLNYKRSYRGLNILHK